MRKKFIQKKRELMRQVKSVRINEILPFAERPSVDRDKENSNTEKPDQLHASQLFSLFTADIIKQDVIFTR